MSMGFSPVLTQFFHRQRFWLAVQAVNLWETLAAVSSCNTGLCGRGSASRSGPSAQSRSRCLNGDCVFWSDLRWRLGDRCHRCWSTTSRFSNADRYRRRSVAHSKAVPSAIVLACVAGDTYTAIDKRRGLACMSGGKYASATESRNWRGFRTRCGLVTRTHTHSPPPPRAKGMVSSGLRDNGAFRSTDHGESRGQRASLDQPAWRWAMAIKWCSNAKE